MVPWPARELVWLAGLVALAVGVWWRPRTVRPNSGGAWGHRRGFLVVPAMVAWLALSAEFRGLPSWVVVVGLFYGMVWMFGLDRGCSRGREKSTVFRFTTGLLEGWTVAVGLWALGLAGHGVGLGIAWAQGIWMAGTVVAGAVLACVFGFSLLVLVRHLRHRASW